MELNEPDLDVDLYVTGITNQQLLDLHLSDKGFKHILIDQDELMYRGVYVDAIPESALKELTLYEEVQI